MRWLDDILAAAGAVCVSVGVFGLYGAWCALVVAGLLLIAGGVITGLGGDE